MFRVKVRVRARLKFRVRISRSQHMPQQGPSPSCLKLGFNTSL